MVVYTFPFPPYTISKINKIQNMSNLEYIAGIEYELMTLFAKKHNITLTIKLPDTNYNLWYDNRTEIPVGMIPNLAYYKADFAFAGNLPSYTTLFHLDYSHWHSLDYFTFYVADPDTIPQWRTMFMVFKPLIWIVTLITFIVFFIIYCLFSWFCSDALNFLETSTANYFMLIGLSLGYSVPIIPKSNYQRILFFAWSVFTLHLAAIYQQHLYSIMVDPEIENSIVDLQTLKQTGLKVCLNRLYFNTFKDMQSIQNELDMYMICNNFTEVLQNINIHKNVTILSKVKNTELMKAIYKFKFHRIHENFLSFPVSILASKGHIALDRLNKFIARSVEAGLIKKWEADVVFCFETSNQKSGDNHSGNPVVLNLQDLQCAFYLLGCGLLLSFIVLLMEIIINK